MGKDLDGRDWTNNIENVYIFRTQILKKENQHIELVDILSSKSKMITTAEINSLACFYRLKLQLS